jgi:ABC-type multidrug transport system fused ATPase/permease subunit
MKNIWRIVKLIPEYRNRTIAVIVVSLLVGAIGAGTPYIYKYIVDVIARMLSHGLSAEEAFNAVMIALAVFAASRAATVLFSFLQEKQADDLWLDMVSTLRQRVFDNMTGLSIDYYEKTRVGEIMDRFSTITQITMWLRQLTEGTLANILQMFFILAMLLVKAPLVGLIMLFVIPFNVIDSWRNLHDTKPYRRGWERLAGRMAGLLAEMVSNIATVRSFGGEAAVKQRYDDTQKEWRVQRGTLHVLEMRSNLVRNVINAIAIVAAVVLVTRGALAGHYTPGDILLVLTLTQNLITTIAPITRLINQAGDIETSAERLNELLGVQPDVLDDPNAVELDCIRTVEFDNVSFAYPGTDTPVLQNVSFKLQQGETLALVGHSGTGKTTIIKLLMRFYDPTSGRVVINGRDIRFYTQRSLRAQMGVVLQDVALFNDSIEENIAFARRDADAEAVREAAIASHAEAFIQRLPEGYDTLVGERGIKLSGGEKQRVAIARAILKNPQLIILDEATSALDSESEQLVQAGLNKLMQGRTAVVIAHRLSTIMNANQILVMQGGRVIEKGDHANLVNQAGGLYAKLYALQVQGQLAI